ncbi:hypothetical protein CEXT_18511 [Caerostris extrusa]|uniref:Uncharacterized protein n=1 Tax=Caerostris extrusa TaxID=172846 RepID=A0AAV4RHS7_CAEEX|nr:hypothetical protein CEXT_18511 [Caerostris extrusa]
MVSKLTRSQMSTPLGYHPSPFLSPSEVCRLTTSTATELGGYFCFAFMFLQKVSGVKYLRCKYLEMLDSVRTISLVCIRRNSRWLLVFLQS